MKQFYQATNHFFNTIAKAHKLLLHNYILKCAFFSLLFLMFVVNYSYSQTTPPDTSTAANNPATLKQKLIDATLRQYELSSASYNSHQLILNQSNRFVELYNEVQKTRNFLKAGFEYKASLDLIAKVSSWQQIAVNRVITNPDSLLTHRNLTATSILLKELIGRTESWHNTIIKFHNKLGFYQQQIDSLSRDKILYLIPDDSNAMVAYNQKFTMLQADLVPVNKALKANIDSIQKIEIEINQLKASLEADYSQTEQLRKQLDENSMARELYSSNQTASSLKTHSEIFNYALNKAELLLLFYFANHKYKLGFMMLVITGLMYYMRLLVKRSKKAGIFDDLKTQTRLIEYPRTSALLIAILLFQFFLPLPPFIVSSLLWLTGAVAITFQLRKSLSSYRFRTWLVFLLLFIISLYFTFILTQSAAEQKAILLMNIVGIAAACFSLFYKPKNEPKHALIKNLLVILLIYQTLSLTLNLSGNYNSSKGFMVNGYFTFVIVLLLYWVVRLSSDTLSISRYFHKRIIDETHQISLRHTNGKLPFVLNALIVIGWFVLLSRSTYAYQNMFGPLVESFNEVRSIGKFEFTLQSVFIFFLVIFLSGVIAKVMSFLTADVGPVTGLVSEKGPGSWLLLVRIAIISAGTLLAFVAAGIPMDRLAVVIGALGVGIGFGLQTLVNNLVSGLIIAFEKPINVGDIVEISGQIGRMKSIGIRSSLVTTWDGADVIIPNGDLLSQHLINWTKGNTRRRFDIPIGVAYGTNLELTQKLLLELMQHDKRILRYPEPFVLVTKFNDSSVDMIMKFWVQDFAIGFDVKSDLMIAVDELFRIHNIVIPFPQRDVYLKSTDARDQKNTSSLTNT